MSFQKLDRNPTIAKKVKEYVRNGVSMRDIIAAIQIYPEAPLSLQTLYKYYGDDIADARASTVSEIGSKVVQQALDGNEKSQELYLRSKGGWSPSGTHVHEEGEGSDDLNSSVVDEMMTLLGKN